MASLFDKEAMRLKTQLHKSKRSNPLFRRIEHTETNDPIRLKCREMLANALELTEPIEHETELCDSEQIANKCEDLLFEEFKITDFKYKNKIKSIVLNLKDPKNPKLKESVRLGIITPERLAFMSVEEMANDDLKELRAKLTQESINDHQLGHVEGSHTSLIVCPNCKKHDVVNSEMQMNVDEPHTTFSYCQDCGYR
jgi:transcription elongation factor S-II